jgi:lysophospholipase L1-like esterase
VGVVTQQQALAGQIVGRLASKRRVQWSLLARSGLTTRQTAQMLAELAPPHGAEPDVAVIVTGVNDVVDQVPSAHAVAEREALVNRLRNAWGVHHVVFAPLPPVRHFPGLPQPLRWVAGTDAERHNRALLDWVATRSDASLVAMHVPLNRGTMADDGFHPGETVYRYCGIAIAEHVLALPHIAKHSK